MSYSLIDIPKENYLRLIDDSNPLYIPMGALSAADATTLTIGLVVSAFSGTSATVTMEESYDAGVSYIAVPSFTADIINATGTFKVKVDAANGPLSPVVRLKIEAAAATTLYFSRVFRTFVQSSVMVPRDVTVSSSAATEATQIQVLGQLTMIEDNTDGLETLVGTTNSTLNAIEAYVDGIEGQLTSISGYVDGIEALIGTTNSTLTTIDGRVDGVEGQLTTIAGYIDGIEALIGTTNTNTGNTTTALGKLSGSLVNVAYDYVGHNYAGATSDVHTYKTGGAGGTTVKTVTINYTDASKTVLSSTVAT